LGRDPDEVIRCILVEMVTPLVLEVTLSVQEELDRPVDKVVLGGNSLFSCNGRLAGASAPYQGVSVSAKLPFVNTSTLLRLEDIIREIRHWPRAGKTFSKR